MYTIADKESDKDFNRAEAQSYYGHKAMHVNREAVTLQKLLMFASCIINS